MKYFNVPVSAQLKNLPVNVISVGGNDFQVPVKRPEGMLNWHVFFTVGGEGVFESRDLKCNLTVDNLIIIKAKNPHSYHAAKEAWKTRWILFSGENVDELMNTLGISGNTLIKGVDKNFLEKSFYDMYNLCKRGYDAITASNILYTLLCEVSRWNREQIKSLPCDAVVRAERYMNSHYDKCITLKEISAFAGVSQQYLCILFKKYHNMRPFQYLNSIRIKKAQELLIKTDMKINEVAEKCCFDSLSYFAKIFKENVGLSPSKFVKYYKE